MLKKYTPEEHLRICKEIDNRIWAEQDLKSMALKAIDHLCYCIEDGMTVDGGLDLIYRFSHCANQCTCYGSHEDWRTQLKEFYKKEILE